MKIAIDIGHARNTGAVGVTKENEHEVSARVAWHLKDFLDKQGHAADIVDFPWESNTDDLNHAIKAVAAGGYELCISLHCDSHTNASACGAHACYYSSAGQKLAACIAYSLATLMPGRAEKTVKRTGLAILNSTRPVAVLVEMGFITNATDALIQRDHPDLIAQRIGQGIINYLRSAE